MHVSARGPDAQRSFPCRATGVNEQHLRGGAGTVGEEWKDDRIRGRCRRGLQGNVRDDGIAHDVDHPSLQRGNHLDIGKDPQRAP